jgi:hypothetical protein
MVLIRCTRKLLHRLAQPTSCEVSTTTALGEWYATILFTKPQQVVLLVNAATRLPVVIPARALSTLPIRFAEGLRTVLTTLQIPANIVAAELREMRDVTFSTTASRSVLGTMNDYAIYIEAAFRHENGVALHSLSLALADTPVGPLGYDRPRDVARRQLSCTTLS